MSSLNTVTLVGHLGRKPELRYTAMQAAYALLSLATNETSRAKGPKQERTEWHRIVTWPHRSSLRPAPGRWTPGARARAAPHSFLDRPPRRSTLVHGGPGGSSDLSWGRGQASERTRRAGRASAAGGRSRRRRRRHPVLEAHHLPAHDREVACPAGWTPGARSVPACAVPGRPAPR